jgi:hypothetical protein
MSNDISIGVSDAIPIRSGSSILPRRPLALQIHYKMEDRFDEFSKCYIAVHWPFLVDYEQWSFHNEQEALRRIFCPASRIGFRGSAIFSRDERSPRAADLRNIFHS